MRASKRGTGSEGRSLGLRKRTGGVAILIIASWALAGPVGRASAEGLRWNFRPGETLRFSIERKSSMSAKAMGTERKSSDTQTVEMSWKVLRLDPSGEAEITQRIDRIRLKAEMPPYMPLEFDSATTKEDPPGFEAITRQIRAQVGAEFTFKMKPNGEITDIKLTEETLKRLREAAPPGAPEGEISEKAVKENLLLQSSPPSFPEGPIEQGKSWSPKPARVPLPFATLIMDKTFTYQGPDAKSPNLLIVAIETNAKLEPIQGADVKSTIRKQEGRGTMTFDGQAGRVVSIRLTQKLDMSIVQAGQAIDQSSDMTTTMSLQP